VRWDVLLPGLVLLAFAGRRRFPRLVTDADPERCDLSRSLDGPGAGHPFGFSVFGCDYLAETVYAAAPP
jgi:hypothetical protein